MGATKILIILSALLAVTGTAPAQAPILSSSDVSFDSASGFYTYHYRLSEQAESNYVGSFAVLVSHSWGGPTRGPVAQSAPTGWSFQSYVSPNTGPNANELYWGWQIPSDAKPASLPSPLDFTFTTPFALSFDTKTNYQLVNNLDVEGIHVIERGHTDAPDVQVTPEPSSLALLAFGVASVAWARRQRGRVE